MVVCLNKIGNNNIFLNTPVKTQAVNNDDMIILQSAYSKTVGDTFTPQLSKEMKVKQKFAQLFPNNTMDIVFNKMKQDFGITTNPKLYFVYDEKSERGGGYSFNRNDIEMNLYDLIASDKKIVGIKNGKRIPLVSTRDKLPLFVNEELAKQFIQTQSQKGNLGFDKLVFEDITPQEQIKFVIHKVAHECVHAKQHQDIRETEGITDKDIIKAWTHVKPKNLIEEKVLEYRVEKIYQNSPWSKMPPAEVKHTKGSEMYNKSQVLLDAIKYYPPVDSAEYRTNALEMEAFDVSAAYVNR